MHESKAHRVGIDRLKTLEGPRTHESIGPLWRVTPKQDVNGLGSGFNTVHPWYLSCGAYLEIGSAWPWLSDVDFRIGYAWQSVEQSRFSDW